VIAAFALALAASAFVERCSTRSDNCDARQAVLSSRAGFCGTSVTFGPYTRNHPSPDPGTNAIVIIADAYYFAVLPSPDATAAQLICLKDETVDFPQISVSPIEINP
jgi:hypothetical protein